MFEKLFKLKSKGSNVKTEIIAGVTTFLTMAVSYTHLEGFCNATYAYGI